MRLTLFPFADMESTTLNQTKRRLRLLVAIASYGDKNAELLRKVIANYRSMDMDVTIFVLCEAPRDFGSGVNVAVGLPSKNPWSLPFAHKKIFAENVDRYDLFIYSEDDMAVSGRNIQAFLDVVPNLHATEIAGYLRYEVDQAGARVLPEVHGVAHWKPDSVKRRGEHTFAEFTNEHAAFYLLTQSQLKKAIASGGFLRTPCEGRYDMLCTAATDPYTNCGFRKVICISALADFLIHHLSNRYVGQLGISLLAFEQQIQTLMQIRDGNHPVSTLCEVESKMPHWEWSKSYYEESNGEVLKLVPGDARTILSIGCGWGAIETELQKRGALVTALPLDSVIGASVELLGLEVIFGSMTECFRRLNGRTFDCVLITDLLHLQRDPKRFLEQLSRFVRPSGTLVIAGPNFNFVSTFIKRVLRKSNYGRLSDFAVSGVCTISPQELLSYLREIGFSVSCLRWYDRIGKPNLLRQILRWFPNTWARRWIAQVRSCS